MQYDVKAAKVQTTSGSVLDQGDVALQRARVKKVFILCGASAGSVVVRQGGASGAILMEVATPASATAVLDMDIPGEGILCTSGLYLTITNAGSVTLFYG